MQALNIHLGSRAWRIGKRMGGMGIWKPEQRRGHREGLLRALGTQEGCYNGDVGGGRDGDGKCYSAMLLVPLPVPPCLPESWFAS